MQFSVRQAAGMEQLNTLVSLACWLLGGQLRELLLIHIFQSSQHAFSSNVSFLIRESLMIFLSSDMIEPILSMKNQGFPGGALVENLPANAEDTGSSPGLGRSHMPRSN